MMFGGKGTSACGVALPRQFSNRGSEAPVNGLDPAKALAVTWLISSGFGAASSPNSDCSGSESSSSSASSSDCYSSSSSSDYGGSFGGGGDF